MQILPLALQALLLLPSTVVVASNSHPTAGTSSSLSSTPTATTGKTMNPSMTTPISPYVTKMTDVPQFDALQAAARSFHMDDKLHLKNLCNDNSRTESLVTIHTAPGNRKIILDYSRQQITGSTMELLFDLADAVGFTDRRAAFYAGDMINTTEGRAVMHHVLRMPRGFTYTQNTQGAAILNQVHTVRDQIETFAEQVRSGKFKGVTGKPIRNVVSIGIGGSSLGPECVMEALRADPEAMKAAQGRILRFLANVDPVDFHLQTHDLNPEETLFVVVSKTFTTAETMLNARTARRWLVHHLRRDGLLEKEIVSQHMVAVSTSTIYCHDFGIEHVFQIWDWVGGRFSVSSAVGLIPLSLHYSTAVMDEFLAGAHNMDQHFFRSPLRDNIPVLLGLLGVWNSTFMGYSVRAILPYSQALKRFPAHIQQVDMESNGKRVASDGFILTHSSGEITFGEPGTCGQHSFYQLLHQGRKVPCDFIGFMQSQQPLAMPGEALSNHDELMANFFAQPDALAYGKGITELIQEGTKEHLREPMVCNGNRPSSSILMTKLDAFATGQLLALYEHRTAVQGFIWGINSFDQYGVELGKNLAHQVRAQLSATRKTGASVQGFNGSTSTLLDVYLREGKKRLPDREKPSDF